MRKFYLAVVFLLCSATSLFSQLYQVDNREKEQNSTLIVEGKVVEQTSFWNPQHTMIFTSNKIKVLKIFKGEISESHIEVLTHGGTVGDMSVHASDLLELSKDEIGVFFCFPNQGNIISPVSGKRIYDVYASSQGFFKYDLFKRIAGDPFNAFSDIKGELYSFITTLTKQNFTTVDPSFDLTAFGGAATANRTNATITSFSPSVVNAGATSDVANNLLTINGTGFGAGGGSAAVLFWDANNNNGTPNYVVGYNSNEIVSWSDTEIKIRVPTRAGTGVFHVRDASGTSTQSPSALQVNYSILTSNGKQSNLVNTNGLGGYFMRYSTNLTTEATTTFNRALKTWVELSGLNVIDGGSTAIESVAGDGNCVVMLDNAAANGGTPLSSGVLGVCYSFTNSCGSNFDNRKPEFDIVLRSSYSSGSTSFAYGPCPPTSSGQIDLETVILHELGHGLNLGHINDGSQGAYPNANPGKLMHYAVSGGVKRTSPDNSAYEGSLYAINGVATNYGACTSQSNMVPLPSIVDAKDEIPTNFGIAPTASGLTVSFDLEHATSNKKNDPPYNVILCGLTGTNITNNLYLLLKTSATGTLNMTVSDLQIVPGNAAAECTGSNTPTFRLALFNRSSAPTSPDDYADPVACRSFTTNGSITSITGLASNTTYLLYVDGKANAKANFKINFMGSALPLKLIYFNGESKEKYNKLNWAIESFEDVDKLVLQRSNNGVDYSTIHQQTNFEIGKDYTFNDLKPFSGKNYYRLAIHNKDGHVEYSTIVMLVNNKKVDVSIFPNPAKEQVKIMITSAEALKNLKINMYNSLGQLMLSKSHAANTTTSTFDINTSNLNSGMYRIQVISSEGQVIWSSSIQKL